MRVKNMLPFIVVIALSYYFLQPLRNDDTTQIIILLVTIPLIILLVTIPLICFVVSIIYGMHNSLSVLYTVLVAVLFVPVYLIFPTMLQLILILAIGYGLVALIGNAIGMIFYRRNVRIKHLEKYSRFLMIAIMGSYIIAVLASAIMMIQMTQITYHDTAWGTTLREDRIDFRANTYELTYYDLHGEMRSHYENSISIVKKLNTKLICSLSLFPLWRKNYYNPGVMDGHHYNIVRAYGNSKSEVYGSNAYPLTYSFVMKAIEIL